MPLVSIIMPTYNAAKFLPRAIQSVLRQDWHDYELLILDNASTDQTPEIVRKLSDVRIRAIRHEKNLGMVRNINCGLELASGKLGIILCADDHWFPGFLKRSVQQQQLCPGLSFTNSMVLQGGHERIFRNVFHGHCDIAPWQLVRHLQGIPLSALMFPLDVAPEHFDERLPFNCDLEFVFRLMIVNRLPLTFIDWPGVCVNLHENNETCRYNIRNENIKLLDIISQYTSMGILRLLIALKRTRLTYV